METLKLEKALEGCKNLVRTGWMQRGIPPAMGETVASHSFESAVIAYVISTELKGLGVNVNPERASVVALFHDLGESVLGDLPKWATERIRKDDVEEEAFVYLGLPRELFQEYRERTTLEGKVAKLAESVATLKQALRYKAMGFKVDEIIDTYQRTLSKFWEEEPFKSARPRLERILFDEVEK